MTAARLDRLWHAPLRRNPAGAIELERALDNMAQEAEPQESTRAWVLRVIGESRLGLGELDAAEDSLRQGSSSKATGTGK